MNVIAAVRAYVDRIVSDGRIGGMKVLLLDSATTQIVSTVYSQSQIMERDVYLVERLGSGKKDRMPHLKAAVFIQPTHESISALCREVQEPRFSEYHVFLSNVCHHDLLQQLATADGEHEVVRQVQEYFADYEAVNEDLFHTSYPQGGVSLSMHGGSSLLSTSVNTLLSVMLSLRRKPAQIRYTANSTLARKVAAEAASQMQADNIFDFRRHEGPLLLVLDRKDDPVTPLLSQWTYQAMVHELLGLVHNRCTLKSAPNVRRDLEEIVLSCTQDEFFARHRNANFGDLGSAVKGLMDAYQSATKLNENINTIEDMQAFLERFPAFKSQSLNVSKHVALLSELARLVEVNQLLDVSQLEQDLACNDDHTLHLRSLMEKLSHPKVNPREKLRLAMLYALRYEEVANLRVLHSKLVAAGVPATDADLVEELLRYGGKAMRAPGLYGQGTLMSMLGKTLTTTLQGVENVYAQHVPVLMSILEAALKGKLKDKDFPCVGTPSQTRPQEIIVFVVGGVTYEEATKVAELNASLRHISVILGGTCIHNSRSFIDQLAGTKPNASKTTVQPMEIGYR